MIFGVGVDIVEIGRIQKAMENRGERFAKKILSVDEHEEFLNHNNQVHFLAKRFAAKEAFSKALGTGFTGGMAMKQVQVGHNDSGRPALQLFEVAKEKADQLKINQSHLSLSDENDYAIAFVTLEV